MEHGFRMGSSAYESDLNTFDLRRTHAWGQLEIRRSVVRIRVSYHQKLTRDVSVRLQILTWRHAARRTHDRQTPRFHRRRRSR